jgi:hypothetical protein
MRLLVSLPETARHRLQSFLELPATFIQPTLRPLHDFGVEGIENLSTKHPFFSALARHPVGVPFHSIISIRHPEDFRQGSDDVVPYWSAHLDGSISETIVPYTHGCVERPETVQAIMKILKKTK